jgi:nitroreductase
MDNRAPTANPADRPLAPLGALRPAEVAELAQALIQTRQSTLPKRLAGPGPDAAQTQTILAAAASAPDHHELLPWRFVVVPESARGRAGRRFCRRAAAARRRRHAPAAGAGAREGVSRAAVAAGRGAPAR